MIKSKLFVWINFCACSKNDKQNCVYLKEYSCKITDTTTFSYKIPTILTKFLPNYLIIFCYHKLLWRIFGFFKTKRKIYTKINFSGGLIFGNQHVSKFLHGLIFANDLWLTKINPRKNFEKYWFTKYKYIIHAKIHPHEK